MTSPPGSEDLESRFRLPVDGTEIVWCDELPKLPEASRVFDGIAKAGDRVELEIEDVALYHIVGGRRIEVRVNPVSDRETAWFFLKATPFGILIQQRGEFPMHAGALVPPGGGPALLVAGDSGAGKSTTCAALIRRGWTLLNDDISRLTFEPTMATVWPGFRSLKLSPRSVEFLGMDLGSLTRTCGFKEKYYWHASGAVQAVRAGALVVLDDASEFVPPERLAGLALLESVYRQTFRPYLVVPLGFQKDHFSQVLRFSQLVPCYRLAGNKNRPLSQVAEILESSFCRWTDPLASGTAS